MHRRNFLRAVVPLSLAPKVLLAQQAAGKAAPPPPAPVPWTLGLNPATPLPQTVVADEVSAPALRFFSQTQIATLSRLADLLLPPLGGKPGALEAEAPAFLDFLIGSSPQERKQLYLTGVDWLESEANSRYHASFAALDEDRAGAIFKPWLRTWMTDHPPQGQHVDFINIVHEDVRMATINSRLWSDAPSAKGQESTPVELYWQPIEPDLLAGGLPRPASTNSAPKSEHTLPSYPH